MVLDKKIGIGVGIVIIIIVIAGLLISPRELQEPSSDLPSSDLAILEERQELENISASTLFRVYSYQKDIVETNNEKISVDVQFELKPNLMELYDEIGLFTSSQRTVVIIPIFTSSAYYSPGFYDYYDGSCGTTCLTTKIEFDKPIHYYMASQNAVKILKLLNYDMITDIDVDKDPDLLKKYDKVILLHNEYVTQKEFDAINNHTKVIYLYPNALYAEIKTNYEENTITLVRGHSYPDKEITNGFDWEFDNTHPYEYDNKCIDWEFYEIDNGVMLNCYPENMIFTSFELLKAIKEL